jgi:signal transduction histidine kinase
MAECFSLAEQCDRELRASSRSLYPPMLDEFGLGPALRSHVAELRQRSGFQVRLTIHAHLQQKRLPRLLEMALFRIIEEALANLRPYSCSEVAHVKLTARRLSNQVLLRIRGGPGVPPGVIRVIRAGASASLGRGLFEIEERVKHLGGEFRIQTGRRSSILTVVLPTQRESSSPAKTRAEEC